MPENKILIYQLLPRLYSNRNKTRKEFGLLEDNGCGKFKDLSFATFKDLWQKGFTHVWFTGVIRHASHTQLLNESIFGGEKRIHTNLWFQMKYLTSMHLRK